MREKFARLRSQIDEFAAAAGRTDHVDVLLAAKTQPAAVIREAITAGGTLLGQNRAQELAATEPELTDLEHDTHFIGMLQSNKVNQVLRYASCVQTVHTVRLVERLARAAETQGRTLDVFIQANTSGEDSKSGVAPAEARDLAAHIGALPALRLRGFMTIGANSPDVGVVRASYEALAQIRDDVLAAGETGTESARELSMGMSQDLPIAIAAGATMVRVGSAFFGSRE